MKFSIIIPVYNVEEYLERCLDSVLNQTYQDFQIILVNDGSTDNSRKICEKYKKQYHDKIKLIHQKNGGLSHARNVGMIHAKGDYLVFIDSDDYIKNTMLETLVKKTELNTDIIGFQHKPLYEKGIQRHHIIQSTEMIISGQTFLNTVCGTNKLYMMVWKYCYKREFIERNKLKFHEGIIHEDEEWIVKSLCFAKTFTFINEELYFYEDNRNGSIMNKFNRKSNICYIQVAMELDKFIKEQSIHSELKKKIKHKIFDFYYYKGMDILDSYLVLNNTYLLKNMTNWKEFLKAGYFYFLIIEFKIYKKMHKYAN